MARSAHYFIRKAHRYLGIVIGLQFLLWTTGGLYFSWSDIDEVHGDFEVRPEQMMPAFDSLVSPSVVMQSVLQQAPFDSLVSLRLTQISGWPYYQLCTMAASGHDHDRNHESNSQNWLVDAKTGTLRPALDSSEAILVAKSRLPEGFSLLRAEYLTAVGKHHEYRENALPAWAFTFANATNVTLYVSTELGTIQKVRNRSWRVFDFFWMLHTMDYQGRDDINNMILRILSVFGLVTILSGFALFVVSSRFYRRQKRKMGGVTIFAQQ